MRIWIRRAVDITAWLALAVAATWFLLRELPLPWQPAIIVAAFSQYAVFPASLALALFAFRRRWVHVIGAALAVVVLVALQAQLYVPSFDGPSGEGVRLNLMQANLRLGFADAPHLVQQVRAGEVEVLTVEELSPEEVDRLDAAGIAFVLPYRYLNPHEGGDGIGIFSRYPLSDLHYNSADFDLGVESAELAGPAGPISVIAVHVTPPWPYPSHHWVNELRRLHSMIDAAPRSQPLIVGGDFNATFDNPQFRALLSNGVRDADRDVGAGILRTYPTDRSFPPLLGLDHVLIRGINPTSVDTIALPGSDHRGLLVDLFQVT